MVYYLHVFVAHERDVPEEFRKVIYGKARDMLFTKLYDLIGDCITKEGYIDKTKFIELLKAKKKELKEIFAREIPADLKHYFFDLVFIVEPTPEIEDKGSVLTIETALSRIYARDLKLTHIAVGSLPNIAIDPYEGVERSTSEDYSWLVTLLPPVLALSIWGVCKCLE